QAGLHLGVLVGVEDVAAVFVDEFGQRLDQAGSIAAADEQRRGHGLRCRGRHSSAASIHAAAPAAAVGSNRVERRPALPARAHRGRVWDPSTFPIFKARVPAPAESPWSWRPPWSTTTGPAPACDRRPLPPPPPSLPEFHVGSGDERPARRPTA